MLFTSATFIAFHLTVVLARWLLPSRLAGPLILLGSYLFYGSWGARYGLLLVGMTLAGFLPALAMERWPRHKRTVLVVAVTVVLAVLGWFKYAGFLAAQAWSLLSWLGVRGAGPHLQLVLPLAISFFTFEIVSYLVDVYRGEPAERSLWRFALYVAYYPHLVAGPIVRAHELLPQLRGARRFDAELFCQGVFLALVGFVKKMVLADNLAPWADAVFASPREHSTLGVWMGVLGYAGQIYCDFSGYTDIARGASMMLGYVLPENFALPYLATSITEFWRRWHMTLSRWLRDYLYISLGGNRRGPVIQYRNLVLTMLLGGLWHGASWTFVAWGGVHGLLLAAHKGWTTWLAGRAGARALLVRAGRAYGALAMLATLFVVTLTWVLFRAPTFARAAKVLGRMFTNVPGVGAWAGRAGWPIAMTTACRVLGVLVLLHVVAALRLPERVDRAAPAVLRGVLWAALIAVCFLFSEARAAFIYFQF
jgi:D-alanyl-lipoteichoic acid acyltransferase DltB (MBOAT superfamily)